MHAPFIITEALEKLGMWRYLSKLAEKSKAIPELFLTTYHFF